VAAVAEVACGVSNPAWDVAAAAVDALQAAEAAMAQEKAAAGYVFVGFEEATQLCLSILAAPVPQTTESAVAIGSSSGGSSWWLLIAAVARCLAGSCNRALLCISSSMHGPALRQAEDLLRTTSSSQHSSLLCSRLVEAAAAAATAAAAAGSQGNQQLQRQQLATACDGGSGPAAAASDSLLTAVAALVHLPSGTTSIPGSSQTSAADHFPLAELLSAKNTAQHDKGLDSDTNLVNVRSELCCTNCWHTCLFCWMVLS